MLAITLDRCKYFDAAVLICRFRIFCHFIFIFISFCFRLFCDVTVSDSAVAVVMFLTFYDFLIAFHFAGMVQLSYYFMTP